MNERLKLIRKSHAFGKSQSTFADFLGVSMANIASYESGRRTPSDSFVALLCSKCNVNETWLLTGEGEMHGPESREQEIARITASLYNADPKSLQYKFIKAIAELDKDQWKNIQDFMYKLLAEKEED